MEPILFRGSKNSFLSIFAVLIIVCGMTLVSMKLNVVTKIKKLQKQETVSHMQMEKLNQKEIEGY